MNRDNAAMSFDELCDRLFNEDDDFWRSSHFAPRDEPSSTPTALPMAAQGQHSALLGVRAKQTQNPEGAPRSPALILDRPTLPRITQPRITQGAAKPESKLARSNGSWLRTFGFALLAFTLLGSAFGFWKGYEADHDTILPIEDRRVGQRAIGDAPKAALATDQARLANRAITWNASNGQLEIDGVVDPLRQLAKEASSAALAEADYRKIILRVQDVWPDGTVDVVNIETLQTWQWIQHHEVRIGGQAPLPLDVIEMGLSEGMAGKVLDILPCPKINPGRGRIILTTVNHLNNDVRELTLRDELGVEETIHPTGNHKFYSVSRGEWLSAKELQPGETLDGLSGKVTVVASRKLLGAHRVYNFTVANEHLYRVANCGVLVHNNGCSTAPKGGVRQLDISGKQFGQKMAQRARELGLDPSSAKVRHQFRSRIERIFKNADEIRSGPFRGQGPNGTIGGDNRFFRRGNDVVVTNANGDFITLLTNGINNGFFKGGVPLP